MDYGLNRALDAYYNDRSWFHGLQKRVMEQVGARERQGAGGGTLRQHHLNGLLSRALLEARLARQRCIPSWGTTESPLGEGGGWETWNSGCACRAAREALHMSLC